jgi:hydroxyethylthiazole kinase-like uncharacterized protein yjeF
MRILKLAQAAEVAGREASPELLIQRAGYAVAQFCVAQFKFRSVCVVCGNGKNGRAGLSAAAALNSLVERLWVILLPGDYAELTQGAEGLWAFKQAIHIREEEDFGSAAAREAVGADLIIDAIVGTGFQPPLRALAAAAVAAINSAPGVVVSVDVPSGVCADSATAVQESGGNMVFAQATIALIAPKPAHVFGTLAAGPIAVSELGVQPALVANGGRVAVLSGRDVRLAFPQRPHGGVEADFGHVLVLGGSRGQAGVLALSALGAMKAGAGGVTIACPGSLEARVAGFSAAFSTYPLPETESGSIAKRAEEEIGVLLARKDAVIVGPALSFNKETAAFIRRFVAACQVPVIICGDGIAAFAAPDNDLRPSLRGRFRAFCCSSAAQAALLSDEPTDGGASDPLTTAQSIAREAGACIILRDASTVIVGLCGETWINLTGGPALAKAGMEEILVGIMGAALARHVDSAGLDPVIQDSASQFNGRYWSDLRVAAAVHLHGLAGDIARDALHEHSLLPTDLLEALGEAFRACDLQAERGLFYLRG